MKLYPDPEVELLNIPISLGTFRQLKMYTFV